jgi:hypothetical protein
MARIIRKTQDLDFQPRKLTNPTPPPPTHPPLHSKYFQILTKKKQEPSSSLMMVKFLIKNEKLFLVGEIFAIVWKYRMHTNVCIRKGATARRVGGRGKGVCHSEIHWYRIYVHVKDAPASERRYGWIRAPPQPESTLALP